MAVVYLDHMRTRQFRLLSQTWESEYTARLLVVTVLGPICCWLCYFLCGFIKKGFGIYFELLSFATSECSRGAHGVAGYSETGLQMLSIPTWG